MNGKTCLRYISGGKIPFKGDRVRAILDSRAYGVAEGPRDVFEDDEAR